ncbi:MAG: flagellar hook-basal body complex protein FliE [Phycisphaerales bacterium]|nr:flagellar hook-basal body complex protein FliE [Planctomycetota bacterium]MCH8508542.1 flagellar hook-basal body complex protein FliE [Phycisphaerales bacterium]
MTDPIGLAGLGKGGLQPHRSPAQPQRDGPDFKAVLMKNLSEVNALQQDANKATEDLMTGRRDDLEGVILATEKADTAFKMLQAMRNQVMQAYDEIKQMRV